MQALLIVDMQIGGFKPETPRFDADGVVDRINRLSDAVRRRGGKVIFIQHDGTREGDYVRGTADWELLPSLRRDPEDIVVHKTANDSFYGTTLGSTLAESGIEELVITGWATDCCVDTTVRSALGRDFRIVVASDAHTTGDRPHLTAEQVITHHNWLWSNLVPTNGDVRVITTESLMSELGG